MFNCLSWGFPKMPLHRFKIYGSPLPVPGCPVSFGRRVATPPSRSVLQVLHLSDGLRLPVACGCISIRFRSWGSPRCMLPRSSNSRVCLPTLRSFPSARSDENPRCRVFSWGACHRCVPLRVPRSPVSLPLSFLRVHRVAAAKSLNLRVLLHEAGPLQPQTVASLRCPVLPWASTVLVFLFPGLRRLPGDDFGRTSRFLF